MLPYTRIISGSSTSTAGNPLLRPGAARIALIAHVAFLLSASLVAAFSGGPFDSSSLGGIQGLAGLCGCLPDVACKSTTKNLEKLIKLVAQIKELQVQGVTPSQCASLSGWSIPKQALGSAGTECLDLWLRTINPFYVLNQPPSDWVNSGATGGGGAQGHGGSVNTFNACAEFQRALSNLLSLKLSGTYALIEDYLADKINKQQTQQQGICGKCLEQYGGLNGLSGLTGLTGLGGSDSILNAPQMDDSSVQLGNGLSNICSRLLGGGVSSNWNSNLGLPLGLDMDLSQGGASQGGSLFSTCLLGDLLGHSAMSCSSAAPGSALAGFCSGQQQQCQGGFSSGSLGCRLLGACKAQSKLNGLPALSALQMRC